MKKATWSKCHLQYYTFYLLTVAHKKIPLMLMKCDILAFVIQLKIYKQKIREIIYSCLAMLIEFIYLKLEAKGLYTLQGQFLNL